MRTQRFNHFAIKAFCALRTATGSSCCQFGDRGEPNDPGLGCATSARLPNMRPVAGKSSIRCPCVSRELLQSGGLTSYPGQELNPRSELTFVRTQRFNHFAIKAFCALRTATGQQLDPVAVRKAQNAFIAKWLKRCVLTEWKTTYNHPKTNLLRH